MSPTSRMPREQRRAQLLALATDLFTEHGFQATSMDDIAAAAGVTKPVLYQHFSSKEDLYGVVIETTGQRLLDGVDSLATIPGDTEERIKHALSGFYELIRVDNALRLFTGSEAVSPGLQVRVTQILDEMSVKAANVLSASRVFTPEQARVVGRSLIAVAQSTATVMDQAPTDSHRAEIVDDIAVLIVRGLTGFQPLEQPGVHGEVTGRH